MGDRTRDRRQHLRRHVGVERDGAVGLERRAERRGRDGLHVQPAALLGAVLFAIYYANWTYGWVTPDDLDFYN